MYLWAFCCRFVLDTVQLLAENLTMTGKQAPFFLFVLFLSCHDDGVLPVSIPAIRGPNAFTERTVYQLNNPITVTISSDTSTFWVDDCKGGLAYYLEFLQGQAWTEWDDNYTPCDLSSAPRRMYLVSPQSAYIPTLVPFTTYPGTYRLRIPYRCYRCYRSSTQGDIITNEFVLEE